MKIIVALIVLGVWGEGARGQQADLVVEHAVIYTVDKSHPKASALAVKDGKLLAVGEDVGKHVGAGTRRIDARGRTIVPGLIDSHGHVAGLGDSLETLNLREANSVETVLEAVKKAAATRGKGEWILGRSWDQTRWPGAQFPNADQLTSVSGDHPVYLTRVDGHAAWVNRKALELSDVNAATKDPDGGKIHKDGQGKPTGILLDRAMGLVGRRIPPPSAAQIEARIARAAAECARLGLTTVHDAGVGEAELAAYHRLVAEGRLPVRVYVMLRGEKLLDEYFKKGPEIGDYLTVRSLKLVADGALGSRGAALKEPYADDGKNVGLMITGRAEIEKVARRAAAAGFQVNTHAIGDRANREVLDAYAAVLGGKNDRRWRVEHAQVVSLEDMPLFAKYSIIASMQATHATSDMRWAETRVGAKRVLGAYAWQRFLKLGVPVANGSDFPVEQPDPIPGFYASVTRQDKDGNPPGGWQPEQRMSREEALESWTLAGAYAGFEEKRKGSLVVGKDADFVMLSRDVMTVGAKEILGAKVVMTVVGGKVVYRGGE